MLKTPKNLIHTKVSAGNLITDISDHLPNILLIDLVVKISKERPFIRLFTPNTITKYENNVINENPIITYENNTNINNNNLHNTYTECNSNLLGILNKYFPLIRQSRKQFKDKPHITNGIKESIKSRNSLFKKYIDNPSETNETNWKNKRNRVVDIIRKAEADYYASFIKQHSDNSKQLWKTFGNILKKTKTKHNTINKLTLNNKSITDTQTITSEFNDFFCTVGEKLAGRFENNGNKII